VFRAANPSESDRITFVRRNGQYLMKGFSPEEASMKTTSMPGTPEVRSQTAAIELSRGKLGKLEVLVWQPGAYELKTADGKTLGFEVAPLPEPLEITGPWDLSFPPNSGAPERVKLGNLVSWSEHTNPGVKYFSGSATYTKTIDVPAGLIAKNRRLDLDLGKVAVMAEVKLNGRELGILWKSPFRVDVTDVIKAGPNTLEVKVVNQWINRQIGDEMLPEDSERNPDGTLKSWPQWVNEGKPSPTGRIAFTSWRLWKKDDPLVESGLLGPVTLRAAERVNLERSERR
jgi:hypothetical protein